MLFAFSRGIRRPKASLVGLSDESRRRWAVGGKTVQGFTGLGGDSYDPHEGKDGRDPSTDPG